MLVRNVQEEPIGSITYEGYSFVIPVGVSAIWEPAGKHFTTHNYRIEVKDRKVDGGAPLPPLIPATEKDKNEWRNKWKSQSCEVTRFRIDPSRLPNRDFLLDLAEKYGVDKSLITRFRSDSRIDNDEIAKAINDLPVPDAIRFPELVESSDESTNT